MANGSHDTILQAALAVWLGGGAPPLRPALGPEGGGLLDERLQHRRGAGQPRRQPRGALSGGAHRRQRPSPPAPIAAPSIPPATPSATRWCGGTRTALSSFAAPNWKWPRRGPPWDCPTGPLTSASTEPT